jgi:hypothetical protein
LFEEHAEAIEGHGTLDRAAGDEYVAYLGGGHELAVAFGGNVEIDGKELFLVLLCPKILIVGLEHVDVIQIEPVQETVVNEV